MKNETVLFCNVPVGSTIRFNGCQVVKLDEETVHFLTDTDGNPVDYSKDYNQRYDRSTCECIGGVPVLVVSAPAPAAAKPIKPLSPKQVAIRTAPFVPPFTTARSKCDRCRVVTQHAFRRESFRVVGRCSGCSTESAFSIK